MLRSCLLALSNIEAPSYSLQRDADTAPLDLFTVHTQGFPLIPLIQITSLVVSVKVPKALVIPRPRLLGNRPCQEDL